MRSSNGSRPAKHIAMHSAKTETRERLAKLLGMTGSHHDNEALVAARRANQLVREVGATWRDLLTRRPVAQQFCPSQPIHVQLADVCLQNTERLTTREVTFCRSIRTFEAVSPHQRQLLRRLYEKVFAAS